MYDFCHEGDKCKRNNSSLLANTVLGSIHLVQLLNLTFKICEKEAST